MDTNREGDSWGQLLSDFGIEDAVQEQEDAFTPEEPKAESRAEGTENSTESSAPEEKKTVEKKSMFSRFPKINFFGTPPEVSLDSVIEGSKSPALGGKAFIDNTLEKMPISQERKDFQKKDRQEQDAVQEPNAWSAVASQIGMLASGGDSTATTEERPARRAVVSIFDDPVQESEEFRALKDLMGEQPRREEEPRRETFRDEESGSRRRRGRGHRNPQTEERGSKEVQGRGARYRPPIEVDDLPDADFEKSDFEIMDNDVPATPGRGRRGARYSGGGYSDSGRGVGRESAREEVSGEEWSEIDAALQSGRGTPAPRRGRHQRHDNPRHDNQRYDNPRHDKRQRQERRVEPAMNREPFDGGETPIVTIHGDTPSWDDAVGDIIAGNIARHRAHTGRGRR